MKDSEGWHSGQKSEFMQILASDKYASLCDQRGLYEKVRETEDSKLMSKLLVAYTDNLANSCIDIPSFKSAQDERKSRTFKTHYEIYRQKVDPAQIKMQLAAGWPIEKILKPYVPTYREWDRLLNTYHSLQRQEGVDPVLVHKVRLNLERVKLLKPETSKNYALVNIPEYRVRIIENGKTMLSMKVVVGKTHLQTPIFGQDLKYIVVNPQWNVPDSIARNEIIPK
ncbi:MAG: L,D-transpeptidase family protein, partial [Sulfurovum sp.]|nr:L,D-transpeptidase family protein [Sulfurovum sp.]